MLDVAIFVVFTANMVFPLVNLQWLTLEGPESAFCLLGQGG
jgi:hypothetical protein